LLAYKLGITILLHKVDQYLKLSRNTRFFEGEQFGMQQHVWSGLVWSGLLSLLQQQVLGTFIKEVKKLGGASDKYCWLWMGAAS